ncbi:MAG: glycosyltransferase [Chloroflexota bacterium]
MPPDQPLDAWVAQADLAPQIGTVIPAFFSATPSDDTVRRLLWMTLGDVRHYHPLSQLCVVVDGDARTARLAEELRAHLLQQHGETFLLLPLPENRGKLWVLSEGIRAVLERCPQVEYLVIRDGDGDHAADDVPHLVRAAAFMRQVQGAGRMIVIGARSSRHRPMGWLRGELETLLDSITLDALNYALARRGRVADWSYCGGSAAPDLNSGFKVYGRQLAQELFVEAEPQLACLSPNDYWHYGPETVPVVEAVLRGGLIAQTARLTWDGQPTTSFGEFRHVSLYGELLAWVYARLAIPLDVAAQMYDNRAPTMALRTAAQGDELLRAVRQHALGRLRGHLGQDDDALPAPRPPMPFV